MSTSEFPANRSLADPDLRPRVVATVRGIPAEAWIVGGLTVLAAVMRLTTIAGQSFWTDEALTAYEAHLPFGAMLNTVAHVETTPPLYFILVWIWAKVFGTGEAALRSLSVLAGVAVVPVAYLSARELFSRRAGMVAAALAAVGPFMIWYSQEARAYMLLAVLSGASFLWFIRAHREATRRNLGWWAAFSALALMTHFFAGFLIAPEALWLLWIARTRIVAVAVGVVAIVQLAMAPLALIDTTHGPGWISAIPRPDRIGQVPLQFGLASIYRTVSTAHGLLGAAILLALVGLLLVFASDRGSRRGTKIAGAIAAFVLIAPLLLGFLGPDYFLARNLIPAWIPLATVIAGACVLPRARVAGALLAVLLVAGSGLAALRIADHGYLQRPAWRELARAIGPAAVPRAILSAGGASANPLKIYLPHVNWVQPRKQIVLIREIDVIGTRVPVALSSDGPSSPGSKSSITKSVAPPPATIGTAMPRLGPPPGMVVLRRIHFLGWVVARFRLREPWRVNIDQLAARAPMFFRHRMAPRWLLAFVQGSGR